MTSAGVDWAGLETAVPPDALVALDTSALLAYLSGGEAASQAAAWLLDARIGAGRNPAVISSLTVAELLVRPFRAGSAAVATAEVFLQLFGEIRIADVTYAVAREAARISSRHRPGHAGCAGHGDRGRARRGGSRHQRRALGRRGRGRGPAGADHPARSLHRGLIWPWPVAPLRCGSPDCARAAPSWKRFILPMAGSTSPPAQRPGGAPWWRRQLSPRSRPGSTSRAPTRRRPARSTRTCSAGRSASPIRPTAVT